MGTPSMSTTGLEIPQLVSDLDHVRNGVPIEDDRLKALETARQLVSTLERPEEVIMRFAFEKLATEIKVQPLFVKVRLMRVLTAMQFAAEVDEQSYVANKLTEAMSQPPLKGATKISHDHSALILHRAHEYFKQHKYNFPLSYDDCAFQWTFDTKQTYFDWIHGDAEKSKDFNAFMGANRSTRRHWTEWYPTDTEIVQRYSPEIGDAMIVDIGGGKGHDLKKFAAKHPEAWGKLVLQDLSEVIADAGDLESDGVRAITHDFFKPQPVIGARVYYTHFVIHDWSDEKAREILLNVKPAMRPGYSRLLLNETVLPGKGCPPFFAGIDWNMMAISAGM
ncbi:MAG: hypothetical protein M1821_008386 [Bathelium mastoideum]|nr:MAG: hypothetical protein M1821_008386 [Bathelium mastoideum]